MRCPLLARGSGVLRKQKAQEYQRPQAGPPEGVVFVPANIRNYSGYLKDAFVIG